MPTRGHLYAMTTAAEVWLSSLITSRTFYFAYLPSGITRFDLLGDFGRYNWLGNFYIVFMYNMLFAGLTSASLINTVTWAVQRELIRAFGQSKFYFILSSKSKYSICIYSSVWHCVTEIHCTRIIRFPTFGPISRWAGLSSSDRKNTILSGKCKGTRGESGLLGDL